MNCKEEKWAPQLKETHEPRLDLLYNLTAHGGDAYRKPREAENNFIFEANCATQSVLSPEIPISKKTG